MHHQIEALHALLREHHDIVDSGGMGHVEPRPNWAMQCTNLLDEIEELIPADVRLAKERG